MPVIARAATMTAWSIESSCVTMRIRLLSNLSAMTPPNGAANKMGTWLKPTTPR